MALGLRIAQLRRERGWSQQELADKLGIAQKTLAHYEVARIRMPASTLPLLSTLFMKPIDTLVGHTQQAQRYRQMDEGPYQQPFSLAATRAAGMAEVSVLDIHAAQNDDWEF